MTEELIIGVIILQVIAITMLGFVLRRGASTDLSPVLSRLETMGGYQERGDRGVREEIARNRQESVEQGRGQRAEVQAALKNSTDSLVQSVDRTSAAQQLQLQDFANQLSTFMQAYDARASQLRSELTTTLLGLRDEVRVSLRNSTDSLVHSVDRISSAQQQQLEDFASRLNAFTQAGNAAASQLRLELTNALDGSKKSQEKRLSDNALELQGHVESFGRRLSEFSQANQDGATQTRGEVAAALRDFKDSLQNQMNDTAGLQKQQMDSFAAQIGHLTERNE